MKKLLNKSFYAYYLVTLYFLTFAAILILTSSCATQNAYSGRNHVDRCPNWANCIHNPYNKEYVEEVAFNLNIKPIEVTQEQFNSRYND